ncbi:MAG: hypothetical protein ABI443_04395 [Chthoniobacterales bacterium]
MEHLLVILILGGIAFFKFLSSQSKKSTRNVPVERNPFQIKRMEIPMDHRMREALGLPTDFRPSPTISKKKELAINPVVLKKVLSPIPGVNIVKAPQKEYLITRHPTDHTDKHIGLYKALSSRSNLRQAIVLKEILDTPKGLLPDFSGYIR